MSDYIRGLLRAAEICDKEWQETNSLCASRTAGRLARYIRAETEKNADRQAGREFTATPSQECHAAGPACSAPEGDYVPLTAEQKQALNRAHLASVTVATPTPDEVLIWEIVGRYAVSHQRSAEAAIREYIRRSAGKEKT